MRKDGVLLQTHVLESLVERVNALYALVASLQTQLHNQSYMLKSVVHELTYLRKRETDKRARFRKDTDALSK